MASTRRTASDAAEPRWAEALSWFAGLILATGGLFGFLQGLSAVGNFMFVPHYPLWALVLIALDLAVIWALTLVLSTEP